MASGGKYAEIWEIWDKFTSSRIIISPQSDKKIVSTTHIDNVSARYFFPTPEPPLAILNGMDLRPSSEVWSYLHELRQLSYISSRKEQLLRGLWLRGYANAKYKEAVNDVVKTEDGEIVFIRDLDPANPNFMNYVDNRPKVELLNILSQEHENLKNSIYEISGISDQMRNISAQSDSQSDETATEIKTKTVFGSRRLREKQDVIISYLQEIYELVLFRVCSIINKETFEEITSLNIPESNAQEIDQLLAQQAQLTQQFQYISQAAQADQQQQAQQQQLQQMQQQQMQQQQMMQPDLQQETEPVPQQQAQPNPPDQQPLQQQQPDPNQQQMQQQQIQQMQQKLSEIGNQLQELRDAPTWDGLINFFRTTALSSVNIDVNLDDMNSLLEKSQVGQKYMEDTNTLMNNMVQILQLSTQYPDYANVFTGILSSSTDNSLYDVNQKREIQNFIISLKAKMNELKNNPPQQQPTPEQIKAQAAQMAAQARMTEAQASAQYDMAKVQDVQSNALKAQAAQAIAQAKVMEAQIKAQEAQMNAQTPPDVPEDNSAEIRMKAALEERKEQLKHEQELQKLQMNIAAQDNRTKDKMASDEHLVKLKIKADDNRYKEKLKADIVKEKLKEPIEPQI
jgi:hypothetical protein